MKRKDGFLDLDEYFKNISLLDETDLVKTSDYMSNQYWLIINDKLYYFKSKKLKYGYRELISFYIAKHLGIESIEYDLAIFKGNVGVISKNYQKPNCKYIPGYDILEDYRKNNKDSLKEMGLDKRIIDDNELNNLEIIWQALEYRYKDIPKTNIEDIVNKLVLQYIFCILIAQDDKGSQNWVVEESPNKIDLVPLFDNEFSLGHEDTDYDVALASSVGEYFTTMYESIEKFLKISSREYIDLFLEKFNILTNEKLLEIMDEIEVEKNTKIPIDIKNEIIENFKEHRSNIESVLIDLDLIKVGR